MEPKDAKMVVHKLQRARYALAFLQKHYPKKLGGNTKELADIEAQIRAIEMAVKPAKVVKEKKSKGKKAAPDVPIAVSEDDQLVEKVADAPDTADAGTLATTTN